MRLDLYRFEVMGRMPLWHQIQRIQPHKCGFILSLFPGSKFMCKFIVTCMGGSKGPLTFHCRPCAVWPILSVQYKLYLTGIVSAAYAGKLGRIKIIHLYN